MEQFASLGSLHPLRSNEGVIGKCQCYAALSTLFDEPISHIWIGKINHDDACFSPWKACPSTPSRRFNRNRGSIIYILYRTFHTINNCANVAMHCLLDTMEKTIRLVCLVRVDCSKKASVQAICSYQADGRTHSGGYRLPSLECCCEKQFNRSMYIYPSTV